MTPSGRPVPALTVRLFAIVTIDREWSATIKTKELVVAGHREPGLERFREQLACPPNLPDQVEERRPTGGLFLLGSTFRIDSQ